MSNSLQLHGLQQARLPCPSLSPGVYSCPLSWWCHPTISSSVASCPQSFIKVFSNELTIHNRWSKYWRFSFSISPSSVYSGLISFRTDWFDLLAVQPRDSLTSSPAPQFESINSSVLSLLMVQLSHPYMTTGKNHSLDYWQKPYGSLSAKWYLCFLICFLALS